MSELNRQMASGAGWMIFFRAVTRLLGFVSVVILARLLVPTDFGLVALAGAIVAGLELMAAFSFDVMLIQRQDALRSHYDTAWTIGIVFALLIAVILVVLAGPAAHFYDEPRLEAIMFVLAAGTLVEGFQNIGVVAFRKDMDFRKEFVFQVARKALAFVVTVPLAFWLRSYWALVVGILAGKVAGTGLSFAVHPYRPRLSVAVWAELFGFSRWLFVNNVLGFLRHRASDFIVGKLAGTGALGVFSVAYELAQLPTNELVAPINRAVFPAYAKIASDLPRLQQSYLDVVAMIAFFAIPAAAGIAVLAQPLVLVVLGPKWVEAVPLVQILGIAGAINALETNIGSAYLALGRPEILTRLFGIYVTLIVVLLLIFTSRWGVIGAAWACLVGAIVNVPLYYGTMLNTLRMPVRRLAGVLWRPLGAAAVMFFFLLEGLAGARLRWAGASELVFLCTATALGVMLYVAATMVLWRVVGRPLGSVEHALLARVAAVAGLRRSAPVQ